MASLTPMMQQYRQIKEKYKDCILFFRLGDFYEMFFDDAITASKELEIALTGRDCGLEERAPMCGVPFHSADSYIARLIDKGYKVAICEQTEDASQAKGLVNRDVIRIITPGTVTDDNMLDEKKNNFLICIYKNTGGVGLSIVDVSTGELYATQFEGNDLNARLINELARYSPTEIIANNGLIEDKPLVSDIKNKFNCFLECFHDYGFEKQNAIYKILYHFKIPTVDSTGLKEKEYAISAVGGLLEYLEQTQKLLYRI